MSRHFFHFSNLFFSILKLETNLVSRQPRTVTTPSNARWISSSRKQNYGMCSRSNFETYKMIPRGLRRDYYETLSGEHSHCRRHSYSTVSWNLSGPVRSLGLVKRDRCGQKHNRITGREFRVILLECASLVVCWSPWAIGYLLESLTGKWMSISQLAIMLFFICLNSIIIPIIHFLSNKRYRRSFQQTFFNFLSTRPIFR